MSEVVVIGNGAAGLLAASRLASCGKEVTVLGRGTPATSLSTSCLDVGDPSLKAFLLPRLERQGLRYIGEGLRLITDIGSSFRCLLAPEWMAKADGMRRPEMVRFPMLQGRALVDRSTVVGEVVVGSRCFDGCFTLSSLARSLGSRDGYGELLQALSKAGDEILIPPVLEREAMRRLEADLGATVAEAVTPLSAQGRRLHAAMMEMARAEGAKVLEGREIVGISAEGRVSVRSGMRRSEMEAGSIIIATGGLVTKGLEPEGRRVEFPLIRLRTAGGGVLDSGLLCDADGAVSSEHGTISLIKAVGEVKHGVWGLSASMEDAWRVAGRFLEEG